MNEHYTVIAVALHWLMVLLVAALIALGLYMTELPQGPERGEFFALHKSLGLSAFLIAVARLIWRLGHAPPPLPDSISSWQRRLAVWNHALLYVLLFAQPVTGYLSSSFSGYKTRFWGLPLPHWGWREPNINELFTTFHEAGFLLLLSLIVLHVCGAVWHSVRHREARILQRMLPGRSD